MSGDRPEAPLAASASLAAAHGLPFTYMTLGAVSAATGKSKSTIYAAIAEDPPTFPEPDHVGGRSLWRSTLIAEYLARQAAAADEERAQRSEAAQAKARRMVEARGRGQSAS